MSAAAESGPDPAARVSVVASIGYFANLAGPPAIGVLAQSAGLLNSFWLIVALFVAAFAAAGSFRPRPTAPAPVEASRPGRNRLLAAVEGSAGPGAAGLGRVDFGQPRCCFGADAVAADLVWEGIAGLRNR
jgi:hypothetical protein